MEFMFGVKFQGLRHIRVEADSIEEAIRQCSKIAEGMKNERLFLSDVSFDVLAPVLFLTEEEKEDWPYWSYSYPGVDGIDWCTGYTKDGKGCIPDFAVEWHPVPSNWLPSWQD